MFDFRKVLNVANYLANWDNEEFVRSAISRYYYSLFGCVRMYLIFIMGESEFDDNRDVHKRICDRLKDSNDSTEHSLGKTLESLRHLRNLADYDWNKEYEYYEKKVDFARKESKVGMEQVESLKKSPPFEL